MNEREVENDLHTLLIAIRKLSNADRERVDLALHSADFHERCGLIEGMTSEGKAIIKIAFSKTTIPMQSEAAPDLSNTAYSGTEKLIRDLMNERLTVPEMLRTYQASAAAVIAMWLIGRYSWGDVIGSLHSIKDLATRVCPPNKIRRPSKN